MIDGANTVASRSELATACSASALARKKRERECALAPIVEKKRKRCTPPRSAARSSRAVATAFSSSIEAPPSWSRIAAARWITVSTPRRALRNEAGLERSPSAICTRTRSPPRRRGSRTRQRTGLRAATSRRSSAVPTLPVAPVRRITPISEPVPLFLPGVGVVVVAVELPEAHAVLAHQLELAHELRRLPEVALGHEQPQRPTVVVLERLAAVGVGQQDVVVQHSLQGQVGGVA